MANSRGFLRRQQTRGNGKAVIDYGRVAQVAYELYEQRGREHGHDLEDWLKAEGIVGQRKNR